MDKIELGVYGEQMAVDHLLSLNFEVLERNFRWNRGEIDIICKSENEIRFIEVKTRETNRYGEPWESVSKSKQRQIIKVAHQYLIQNDIHLEARFDVVSIVANSHHCAVQFIPDAFYPTH